MSDLPSIPDFATAHEMATTPRRADWLIESVIPRGSFGLLFGDPGTGKSFTALAWAFAIASGLGWLGRGVRQGPVIYIAGEGFGGIGRRVAAWCLQNGAQSKGMPVHISRDASNFLNDEIIDMLIEDLRAAYPSIALIVVDTMARATPGMNEDRANEVGVFVDACDRLRAAFPGATVLVLHHSPHSDKSRAKGSIALKGAVDFEAGLISTAEEGVVKLTCTKMKDGEPFADLHLRFQPVDLGDGTTSAVLTECDAPAGRSGKAPKIRFSANDKLLLLVLGSETVEEASVRAAFLRRHPSTNKDSAAKGYLRARRRGLERRWFIEDGKTLIPSTADIMRDRSDRRDVQEGQ